MLVHLLYASKRDVHCNETEINNILAASVKNNPALGITGILLYTETRFIQYVEGEYGNVMPLYEKIKKDTRHQDVQLISLGLIQEKIFPQWYMGSQKTTSDRVEFLLQIEEQEKVTIDGLLLGKIEQGKKVQKLLQNLA
ncbi:MAG: BLUF domain-containing protein [Cytophagales bacterium]|nr:MAG: BLUF domain-containing protein [Cytophagales bacterium]